MFIKNTFSTLCQREEDIRELMCTKKISQRAVLVLCFIIVNTATGGCNGHSERTQEGHVSKERIMSESAIINPNRFADMQSSSFLPVSGRISDNEVWFAKTIDTDRMRIPLNIGLHGDDLVVSYGSLLAVLNRQDGSTIWKREIMGNHVASMDEDGIHNLDHPGYNVPLGYDGQF